MMMMMYCLGLIPEINIRVDFFVLEINEYQNKCKGGHVQAAIMTPS